MQNDLRLLVGNETLTSNSILPSQNPSIITPLFVQRGRLFALSASATVIIVGGLVLLGWTIHSPVLIRVIYGGVAMKPMTALCFIIAGIGLHVYSRVSPAGAIHGLRPIQLARGCGGFIALIGLLTLFEYLSGFDSRIHELLFRQSLQATGALHPGRMALATAICFLLFGIILLFFNTQTRGGQVPAQYLALGIVLFGLIALQGYLFDVEQFYDIALYSSMSLHTALAFIVLGIGTLLAQMNRGWMAIVASRYLGGVLIRRLLPVVIGIPLVIAGMRWQGEKAGWYGTGFGLALFATSNMIILGFVVWRSAYRLNALDELRLNAELKNYQITNSLPQLVWTCRPDGECDFFSQQWIEYTGAALEKQLGFGWLNQIHPDDRDKITEAWQAALATGNDFRLEFRIRRYDEVYRWFDTRAVAWRDQEGRIVKWFGSNTDIHEQHEIRERLRENEFRLAGIINSAMDGIITVDEDQRIVLFNAAAEKMFGYSAPEVLGKSLDQLLPERFRAAHHNHLRGFGETQVTRRTMGELGAIYGLRANGEEFPIEASISQLVIGGQKLFTVILRDLTERRQTEQAMVHLAAIVESSDDAIISKNLQGIITSWNRGAEKLFGYSAAEAIGQPITMLIPAEYTNDEPQILEKIRRGETVEHYQTLRRRKDGTLIDISLTVSPIWDEAGNLRGASKIARNITASKRAEERFRQVIEHTPNGMVMVNQQGKIVLVNAQVEKSFGYTRDELLGQSIEMLVPERFRAHHADYRNSFFTAPSVRSMGRGRDLFGLRKDGSEFPVEIGLNPLETEQGVMVLGTIIDISERQQAEQIIRESQQQLAGVIASAMDAIITVDSDQRIVLFNAAAEKMFRCSPENAIGQPLDSFIPERFRATHQNHIRNFGLTHVTRRTMGSLGAIFGKRTDGEEFPIEASISQLEAAGQKFYTVILRDITERKRAEEALQESEERFRLMADSAPVLIWVSGIDKLCTYFNKGWLDFTGRTLAQESGNGWAEGVHADDLARCLHTYQTAFDAREPFALEYRLRRYDGEYRWLLDIGSPRFSSSGSFSGYIGSCIDITERKHAEEALRESEALFATVFQVSPISISISHLETGQYLTVNDTFLQRYGLTLGEVIGHTSYELGLWVSLEDRSKMLRQLYERGKVYNFETQYRTKSGELGNVMVSAEIIEQAGESYMLSIGYDITESKQAEEAVMRSRAELEAVFQSIQEGLIVTDMAGNFLLVNDAEARLTGFRSKELMMQNLSFFHNLFELLHPDGRRLSVEEWPTHKVLNGQSVRDWELRGRRLDTGKEGFYSFSGEPVFDRNGQQILCVISTRDITERKQVEEEIYRLNAELEERVAQRTHQLEAANKELEAFSYSVSHDLRSPLRTVDGFSQAVLEDFGEQLPESGRRYLYTIREGAQRMGALIDDLLAFSRLSRQPLNKTSVNAARLVQDVLKELQAEVAGREVEIRVGDLPRCEGDPTLLKQVWVNLIANALKYSRGRHPAIIEIGCELKAGQKIYFVRDNGTGFDMQYAHKLFGVFQRLHRAEDFEGTGVGLAIVQRVIHRHGGQVWADAALDKGATFYFTLEGESI